MRNTVCLLFVFLSISCNKPVKRNNEITKVELARSGAWSDFGASINIDTSLNYKYFGDHQNIKQGFFVGKVNSKFWDTLNQKLEKIKFKTLRPTTQMGCKDCEYYELIVHWGNKKRRIIRVWVESIDSVYTVFKWLNDSYEKVKLKQIPDSIKFETTFHNLPKPPIDMVKFPPPLEKPKHKHVKVHRASIIDSASN